MNKVELEEQIKKAEQGDVTACINVANYYIVQPHTNENRKKAFTYYEKAADLGHAGALYQVGYMRYFGDGTYKDGSNAAGYIKMAADKGYADAQYSIACMLKNGEYGFFATEQKAFKYFMKAAEQGHAGAQIVLGDIFLNEKNMVSQAIFWWACAYQHGKNSPKDSGEAKERLINLVESGILRDYDKINSALEEVKNSKYSQYLQNPKR